MPPLFESGGLRVRKAARPALLPGRSHGSSAIGLIRAQPVGGRLIEVDCAPSASQCDGRNSRHSPGVATVWLGR